MSAIADVASRLFRAISIGRIKATDDSGVQQLSQVNINAGAPAGIEEVIDDVERLGHYGFAYCAPVGAEAVLLHLGGHRSAGMIIATGDRATRPKGLLPGEARFYNGPAGTYVEASHDGKFRSVATDWLHTGDYHVSGTSYAAHMIPADGASGSFTTVDGKTVTVTHGIITNIA